MIRHAINQAANGLENITIRIVDSDVLVLLLSSVERLIEAGVKSVFTVLVKKNGTEEFDLIKILNKFGADICRALPFLHAFSGCDTSSSFYGKDKSTLWNPWMSFSKSTELTHTFIELGSNPFAISEENIRLLKLFILYVYFGKSRRYTDIYHTGWLWRVCVDNVVLPGPELWVWKPYFDLCRKYFPRWEQEDSQTTIQDFVTTCGCKTSNCVNCKCGRLGKKCFDFSKCQRKCQNI